MEVRSGRGDYRATTGTDHHGQSPYYCIMQLVSFTETTYTNQDLFTHSKIRVTLENWPVSMTFEPLTSDTTSRGDLDT